MLVMVCGPQLDTLIYCKRFKCQTFFKNLGDNPKPSLKLNKELNILLNLASPTICSFSDTMSNRLKSTRQQSTRLQSTRLRPVLQSTRQLVLFMVNSSTAQNSSIRLLLVVKYYVTQSHSTCRPTLKVCSAPQV